MDEKSVQLFCEKFVLRIPGKPCARGIVRIRIIWLGKFFNGEWCWHTKLDSKIDRPPCPTEIIPVTHPEYPDLVGIIGSKEERIGVGLTAEHRDALLTIYAKRDEWFPVPVEYI